MMMNSIETDTPAASSKNNDNNSLLLSSRKRPLHVPIIVDDAGPSESHVLPLHGVISSSQDETSVTTSMTTAVDVSSSNAAAHLPPPNAMTDNHHDTTTAVDDVYNSTMSTAADSADSAGAILISPPSSHSLQSEGDHQQQSLVVDDADDARTSKDYYFDSYSHHAIHEEMLKDEVRTRTFQMAILQNPHLFQDKIILDVGCGTAILSMFAVQAGAKHVYGVDCSTIIDQAQQIVERNGMADRITLIKGKIEEIELPVPQVDVIISEWMGYFLLYESMLDTVLYARDKWLVPNGVLFPDKAIMYICAAEDAHVKTDRIDFWDDVYGFDMTPLKEIALKEPVVDVIDSRQIVTDAVPILRLDILTCTKEDLVFRSNFTIQAKRSDCLHALVTYFECAFTQGLKPIGFSTSPFARYTHWKQTLLYLREPINMRLWQKVSGEISCRPNIHNRRDLDIGLVLHVHSIQNHHHRDGDDANQEEQCIQMNFRLR